MKAELQAASLYWSLFLCQLLAATCFSFLDIQYQTFGTEFCLWLFAYGITLALAYSQRHGVTAGGRFWRSVITIICVLLGLFVLLTGGLVPRSVILLLVLMQLCYNSQCLLGRRQFYFSQLMSLMIVIYACNHYRADWSLLFYVLPYVACLIFSVIHEQIQHKTRDLRQGNQQLFLSGAQLLVSVFSVLFIMVLTGVFYLLTPQLSWHSFDSRWGEVANSGSRGEAELTNRGQSSEANGNSVGLSSQGMRDVAARPGMPNWQSNIIRQLAEINQQLAPLYQLQAQLKRLFVMALPSLLLLCLLLLLVVLGYLCWRLIRESQMGLWLLTRFDYLRLTWLRGYWQPTPQHYYYAMQRLFNYHRILARDPCNTQEYLTDVNHLYRHIGNEASELTRLYEDFRYGTYPVPQIADCYWRLFHKLERF